MSTKSMPFMSLDSISNSAKEFNFSSPIFDLKYVCVRFKGGKDRSAEQLIRLHIKTFAVYCEKWGKLTVNFDHVVKNKNC
jgi:hypothetical protein